MGHPLPVHVSITHQKESEDEVSIGALPTKPYVLFCLAGEPRGWGAEVLTYSGSLIISQVWGTIRWEWAVLVSLQG